MGKFAIDFSEESPLYRIHPDDTTRMSFVVAEETESTDGPFQKTLCYASYYMMTFTAFCVFTPNKVAFAADVIKSSING